jgi:hypothetical protein
MVDDLIKSKILEAVQSCGQRCSQATCWRDGHNFGDAVYWGELESGWVLLAALDFMRLVVFQMDDWEQSQCITAISTDDPEYAKQRSSRSRVFRGTAQKPCLCHSDTSRGQGAGVLFVQEHRMRR